MVLVIPNLLHRVRVVFARGIADPRMPAHDAHRHREEYGVADEHEDHRTNEGEDEVVVGAQPAMFFGAETVRISPHRQRDDERGKS